MKILNYLRIKFHPLLYLKSFKSIRNILNKLDFIYYKKSNKFGNYYCYFIKHLYLVFNEENKERPYPKRFDVAVPANMMCGKISK